METRSGLPIGDPSLVTSGAFGRRSDLVDPPQANSSNVLRPAEPALVGPWRWVVRSLPIAFGLLPAIVGAAALLAGWVDSAAAKHWLDRWAADGAIESLTPTILARLSPWLRASGAVLVALAFGAFARRAAIEHWLVDCVVDAPTDTVGTLDPPHATGSSVSALVAAAATALVLWGVYLSFGFALWSTGVMDHFDGLFHSDPPRVIRDLAAAGADGGRSHLHPLFVLFLNPLGNGLARILGAHAAAAIVLTSFAGAASVFLGQLFFHTIGMPFRLAVLWSILLGATTSHLVFSATPETFIFAVPPVIACCILMDRQSRFAVFVAASIVAVGMTITNVATPVLIYLFSRGYTLRARVMRVSLLLATVLGSLTILALVQNTAFPRTKLFFSPTGYRTGVFMFVADVTTFERAERRANDLARHMFAYTILAPEPYVGQEDQPLDAYAAHLHGFECPQVCAEARLADPRSRGPYSHPPEITFESTRAAKFHPLALVGLVLWAAGLLVAVRHSFAKRGSWVLPGIVASLGFQFILHFLYGPDPFLYSAHWAFLLVAGVALAIRPYWNQRVLLLATALMLMVQVLNNAAFAYRVFAVLSHHQL